MQNKPNFKGKKMLLYLTINGRRESFGYYADEIEAAKAYDRVAKKYRVDLSPYICYHYFC